MTDNDIIDHDDLKLTVERVQAYSRRTSTIVGNDSRILKNEGGPQNVLTGAPGPTRTGDLRIRRALFQTL